MVPTVDLDNVVTSGIKVKTRGWSTPKESRKRQGGQKRSGVKGLRREGSSVVISEPSVFSGTLISSVSPKVTSDHLVYLRSNTMLRFGRSGVSSTH